ncbi:hypothetical protein BH11BAC7_BH11BAC7_00660 [soil metagenome]
MKNLSLYTWTTSLLALFSGGSLIVLFVLVPFWHSMESAELIQFFKRFGGRIAAVMLPMEVFPLVLSFLAYSAARKNNADERKLWLSVNISNILILLTLFVYFIPVNLSFINATISRDDVPAELIRWQIVHGIRTLLTLVSAVLAILALSKLIKERAAHGQN